jgi:hypothetical protein
MTNKSIRSVIGPVLGIESSCDDTAAAVLDADGHILAEAVLSQADHTAFGGVVPEIAARAHLAHLPGLVEGVMHQAGLAFPDLAAVAASSGPGLIGGLIVGSGFAKGVAIARGLPFVAVNHLEAHALTARLPGLVPGGALSPYLLMLWRASGGIAAWAGRLMTRLAKPLIKLRNYWGWDGLGDRRWNAWRWAATPRGLPCRVRCWGGRVAISVFRG